MKPLRRTKKDGEERIQLWTVETYPRVEVKPVLFLKKQSLRKLGLIDARKGTCAIFETREKARQFATLAKTFISYISKGAEIISIDCAEDE